jgi:predicted DNA-binding ribbon-helix-helix protein
MLESEYIFARVRVRRAIWLRLRATAIRKGQTVAELVGSILEEKVGGAPTNEG